MKNILYIGPYREFSGMGNAARVYIESLLLAGHNVCIKPIYNIFKEFPENEIHQDILDLENNEIKNYDIVYQHTYPHQYCYDYRFSQNIGILHLEAYHYHPNLAQYVNMMDSLIVGSEKVAESLHMVGDIKPNIRIIPEPINLDFINTYKDVNKPIDKDSFTFYTIADFIPRKNFNKLLLAFILAFNPDDKVDLVIKTKNYSDDGTNISELLEYEFNKIYQSTKLIKNIKKIKIIVGDTSYSNILFLHNNNDCFVNISMGESFGYSTLEAMAFNNNIIVNKNIGSADILDAGCGAYVDSTLVNCFDYSSPYFWNNSVRQQWYDISIDSLINQMILATQETNEEKKHRIKKQKQRLKNFDMSTISPLFIPS
jgi:glycosyltransferase involved in cell wall biosynthesis